MDVIWVEEVEEAEGVTLVEEEGCAFGTFPPNIRLRSLVQLEPFEPFFMAAESEEEDIF